MLLFEMQINGTKLPLVKFLYLISLSTISET